MDYYLENTSVRIILRICTVCTHFVSHCSRIQSVGLPIAR
jgi:hypothetical protein